MKLPRGTVSARVAQLEKHLNVRLFKRNTRSVQLTAEGSEYLVVCKEMLGKLGQVEHRISHKTELVGSVRISVPALLPDSGFLRLLKEFQEKHPATTIDIVATDKVLNFVEDNIDLAIRGKQPVVENVVARKLYAVDMVLVNINDEEKVFDPESMPLLDPLSMAPFAGVKQPVISSTDLNAALGLALLGVATALLPRPICEPLLASRKLVELPSPLQLPELQMFLLYEPRRYLSPLVSTLIDHLLSEVVE